MRVLTTQQIQRIYEVTDGLGLHRTWLIVPLAGAEVGQERVMPDGKVLIGAPAGPAFELWLTDLRRRLGDLELARTPRSEQHQPHQTRGNADGPVGSGARRYLPWAERFGKPGA